MIIRHRYSGKVIFDGDVSGLRGADLRWADLRWVDLRGADLRWVDLRWVDLRGADLRGADLSGADLYNTIGDGEVIRSAQFLIYMVVVCDDWLQIGCEGHRVHEWAEFSDDEIDSMAIGALDWWLKHREAVFAFAGANDFGVAA